jgi:hypothetical protein
VLTSAEARLSSGSDIWSMDLAQVGRGGTTEAVGAATVQGQQNRVTYDYGSVSQWFVNGPPGLEQGFTLFQAPVGNDSTSPLIVQLRLGGNLHATANAAGDGLTLSRADGSTVWTYGGLQVFDSAERSLPVCLVVRSSGGRDDLVIQVDDVGAQYPLTIDPLVQQAKLTASDGVAGDNLGGSVAISGDGSTVVAGAPDDTGAQNSGPGAVYVFMKSVTGWANTTEIAKLTASDGASGDLLGLSVAISNDGTTVVAGAPFATIGGNEFRGAAYVFVKPDTGWATTTQTAKLTASDGAINDAFGSSVAISSDGTTVVAGAPNPSAGAVYVFVKPGLGWTTATETAKLIASDGAGGDQLGASVAISGDGTTVVAGAPQVTTSASTAHGAVYVFMEPPTRWFGPLPRLRPPTITESAKLTASDGADFDQLGASVAISNDGTTVAAGAPDATVGGNGFQGAAYVFVKPETGWATTTQTAKFTSSDGAYNDRFGYSVAISGDGSKVVAAAILATIGGNQFQGAVYAFMEPNTGWTTTTQTAKGTASDGAGEDQLGTSVAISGDGSAVVAGAPGPSGGAITTLGALYVFVFGNLASSTTTVSDAGGTYNGSPFAATGTVSGVGGLSTSPSSFSYVGTGSTSYGPTATAPLNAGTYSVTATYDGDTNHSGSMATTTFTISQATSTTTVSDAGGTYNGLAFAATGTVSGVGGLSTSPSSFSYAGTGSTSYGPTASAPVNAGTYSVTASYSGDTNHAGSMATTTFTISQATSTTAVSDAGGTYNGSPFAATGTVSGVGGLSTTASSFSYAGTGSTSYGPTVNAPLNAGAYSVTATYNGDANHTGSMAATTFTISSKTLTVTASNQSKTYGTNFTPDGTSQFTTSGLVSSDRVSSVMLASEGYASAASGANSPYAIIPSAAVGTGLSNYTINYVNGMLIVNPAPLLATPVSFSATAGAPFSGPVATFSNVLPNTAAYTAFIDWGDGTTSSVSISVSGSNLLTVTGSHPYADPNSYLVNAD